MRAARTGDVTTNDSLDFDDVAFLDDHAATLELIPVLIERARELVPGRGRKTGRRCSLEGRHQDVVRDNVRKLVEPVERKRGECHALVRDTLDA